MKKYYIFLAAALVAASCKKQGHYVLTGHVPGAKDGAKAILEQQQGNFGISLPVDTVEVKGGQFVFEGKSAEPALYLVAVEGIKGKTPIILEGGDISLDINKDDMSLNKMGGTDNNKALSDFIAGNRVIQQPVMAYQKAHDMEFQTARAKNDTATMGRLMRNFKMLAAPIREKSEAFRADFVKKHPDALVSVMMLENMAAAPGADFKKIKASFNNLDAEVKNSREGKKLEKQLIEMSTVKAGHSAPDFSAPDVNGKTVTLRESLGKKATVIDFWASWCPPCRAENPNMVALYRDFHDKGVNIIGISLDKNADDWKAAIAKDGLTWTEVSNLKYWDDPIAASYNVQEIPQTFVVNPYGIVVARGLKGEALRKKIAEMTAPVPARQTPTLPIPQKK